MTVVYTGANPTIADIYIITCKDGSIARFTSHDSNIVYAGNTYQAIPISRSNVEFHSNLQVDKVDISFGLIGITVGTSSYSIPQVIRRGFLREAHVEIYRVDYVALNDHDILFDGYVSGDISFNAGVVTLSVGSMLDRLNDKFPKIAYTETCNHKLYGTYCGLTKNDYRLSGTADTGSTQKKIYHPLFAFAEYAEGYWVKGELRVGQIESRSIETHGDGFVTVMFPFEETIEDGITEIEAWPGCDKTDVTCNDKFSNIENFLGFTKIPKPETLYYA
jgi:uncharacterized phage protein (TIGR02218 family)